MRAIPIDQKEYDKAVAKVKARVLRWPSAYASGQVVIEYKRAMAARGITNPYKAKVDQKILPLARWYKEKWIDIKTGKPCGSVHTNKYYPTCRPSIKVTKNTPIISSQITTKQKKIMIKEKQNVQNGRVQNYKMLYNNR